MTVTAIRLESTLARKLAYLARGATALSAVVAGSALLLRLALSAVDPNSAEMIEGIMRAADVASNVGAGGLAGGLAAAAAASAAADDAAADDGADDAADDTTPEPAPETRDPQPC